MEPPPTWSPDGDRSAAAARAGSGVHSPLARVVEFLQCDAPVAGVQPREQEAFEMWCAWVRQQ